LSAKVNGKLALFLRRYFQPFFVSTLHDERIKEALSAARKLSIKRLNFPRRHDVNEVLFRATKKRGTESKRESKDNNTAVNLWILHLPCHCTIQLQIYGDFFLMSPFCWTGGFLFNFSPKKGS
jgi:hypothetical protein